MRAGAPANGSACLTAEEHGAETLNVAIDEFLSARKTGQIVLHVKNGVVNRAEFWGVLNLKVSITPPAIPYTNVAGRR